MIAFVKSPPGWFTLLLVAALAIYFGWLAVSGAAKVQASGLPEADIHHGIEVVLSIAPEQFHMTRLQAAGRLIRFEDRSAYIMDLPDAALDELARNYWVEAIRPWEGLQP